MLEITKLDGFSREVWEVIVGVRGSGTSATVHVQVCSYRREMRLASRSRSWLPVAYWSPCTGPNCRVPVVPEGHPTPKKLEAMPVIEDAEMLKAVQARMEVSWS